jgi:hypothetical protein
MFDGCAAAEYLIKEIYSSDYLAIRGGSEFIGGCNYDAATGINEGCVACC